MSMSHVFYLKGNKAFFITIKTEDNHVHVIVPIANKAFIRLQLEDKRFMGTKVAISQVRPYHRPGCTPGTLFQLSSRSDLVLEEDDDDAMADDEAIYFEGIVTDSRHATSGVVILNRRVVLIATAICHITNVRMLAKGQKVTVANAARVELPEATGKANVALVLGAKSFLRPETDGDLPSLHCKPNTSTFGSDTIVETALRLNCNHEDVLRLVRAKEALQEKFKGEEEVLERISVVAEGRNLLSEIMTRLHGRDGKRRAGHQHRSLIDEYLARNDAPKVSQFDQDRTIEPISAFRERMQTELEKQRIELESTRDLSAFEGVNVREVPCKECFLLGFVRCDPVTGQMMLEDATGKISLCLGTEREFALVGCVICLTNVTATVEWSSKLDVNWQSSYLSVASETDVSMILKRPNSPPSVYGILWRVMLCSSALQSREKDNGSVLIMLVYDVENATFMHAVVDLALLRGLSQIPAGTKLRLQTFSDIEPYSGPISMNQGSSLPRKGPKCKLVRLLQEPKIELPELP